MISQDFRACLDRLFCSICGLVGALMLFRCDNCVFVKPLLIGGAPANLVVLQQFGNVFPSLRKPSYFSFCCGVFSGGAHMVRVVPLRFVAER